MDEAFEREFPTTPSAELASRYGVSARTIARWASRLGLKKSSTYRSAVARTAARTRDPQRIPRGTAHWNWKGGRPWERFKDPAYVVWRNAVLERDDYTCRICGRRCQKYERGLAAHHIVAWATAPETRFDLANGVTLCRSCHMELHGRAPAPADQIPCACGCGTLIAERDVYGRPRRYVNGHGKRGRRMTAAARRRLSEARRGTTLTPEHRAKISAGLRSSAKRIGRPPRTRS